MSDDDPKFEREDYGKLAEGQSGAQFTTAQNDLTVKPHCDTGDCTAKEEEPAEEAWIKLMSAVPQADQITKIKPGREGTMLLPDGKSFQDMVSSIRPQPEADYALDTIRDEWSDFYSEFETIRPKLQQGLTELSSHWKGEDFDSFEEQAETVFKNCKTILSDVGGENGTDGVIKVLTDKQEAIFEQQGGTSAVYPAPKFYMEGTKCGSHRIHIRPPFFRSCQIEENDEIKHGIEMAGFDAGIVDDIQGGRQQTYDQWADYVTANPDYEEGGVSGQALAQQKADEYADKELVAKGAKGSEILEEQAQIVNEEVTERHGNTEAHVQEIEPDSRPSEATTFNDGETPPMDHDGLDGGPDIDGPPDVGGPDGGGDIKNMEGPGDLKPLGDDGTGGPGGGGLGGDQPSPDVTTDGLNGLDDDDPWSSGVDPDNVSGNEVPPGDVPDSSLNGGTPPGGSYAPDDLESNPWDSGDVDPDDVSGGLAGGSGGPPPGSVGGAGGLSGGGLGGGGTPPPGTIGGRGPGPGGLSGRGGGRVPSGPKKLDSGKSNFGKNVPSGGGPRKLDSGRGSLGGSGLGGKSSGLGGPPGSGGRGSGLGSAGGSAGGTGSGSGGPGSKGGGLGAGGKGGPGQGGGMIAPGGGAAGGKSAAEQEAERQFWIVEDEEVWGGGPEDEDDDPYA